MGVPSQLPPTSQGTVSGVRICACGRDSDKVHCPACGSTNLYGREGSGKYVDITAGSGTDAPTRDVPDGQRSGQPNRSPERVWIRGFRCRRCGHDFNELDTLACSAPKFETKSMRERRAADAAVGALEDIRATQGRRAMLEFVARNYGPGGPGAPPLLRNASPTDLIESLPDTASQNTKGTVDKGPNGDE